MTESISGQLCIFGLIDNEGIADIIETTARDGFGLSATQDESFKRGRGTIYGHFDSEHPSDDVLECLRRLGLSGEWCGFERGPQKRERIQVTMFDAPSGRIVQAHSFTDDEHGTIFLANDATAEDMEIHARWPYFTDIVDHKGHARLIYIESQHDALANSDNQDIYPGSFEAYAKARALRHASQQDQS
jgi:hypothetical protein